MSQAKITLRCPRCYNREFKPKGPYSSPVMNIGGTERTADTIIRRYICLECGYSWKTIEKFYDHLEIHGNRLIEQLYRYMREFTPRAERKNLPSLDEFLETFRKQKLTDPRQTRLDL